MTLRNQLRERRAQYLEAVDAFQRQTETIGRHGTPAEIIAQALDHWAQCLPPHSARPPAFVIGLPRGGSTLQDHMVRDLCLGTNDYTFLSLDVLFKATGVPRQHLPENVERRLYAPGRICGGMRAPRADLASAYPDVKKLVLVRDVRDAAVSNYFYTRYGQQTRELKGEALAQVTQTMAFAESAGIDAYALALLPYYTTLLEHLAPLAADPNALILRYEDVIFDQDAWSRQMTTHLGLEVTDAWRAMVVAEHARPIPAVEQEGDHMRRVTPGDHRVKLSPDTIARYNGELGPMAAKLGYSFTTGEFNILTQG